MKRQYTAFHDPPPSPFVTSPRRIRDVVVERKQTAIRMKPKSNGVESVIQVCWVDKTPVRRQTTLPSPPSHSINIYEAHRPAKPRPARCRELERVEPRLSKAEIR